MNSDPCGAGAGEEILVEEETPIGIRDTVFEICFALILTLLFIAVTALSNLLWRICAGYPAGDLLSAGSAPPYVRMISRTAMFLFAAFLCRRRGTLAKELSPKASFIPAALILGAALQIAGYFVLSPASFISLGRIAYPADLTDTASLMLMTVSVIFSPAAEELLFRGVIYRRLRRVSGSWAVPAVISSLLFALSHSPVLVTVISFLAGLFLAYCTEKTDSVFPAILVHASFNLTAFALGYFPFSSVMPKVILLILSAGAGAFALFHFRRRGNNIENKHKGL